MVVEQGTILDRIDYNVESARDDTLEANKHLEAVRKMEKSTLALSCIKCQVITIVILLVVIIVKFTA